MAVGKNTLSNNKELGYRLPGEVVQFLPLEIVYQNKITFVDSSSADGSQTDDLLSSIPFLGLHRYFHLLEYNLNLRYEQIAVFN